MISTLKILLIESLVISITYFHFHFFKSIHFFLDLSQRVIKVVYNFEQIFLFYFELVTVYGILDLLELALPQCRVEFADSQLLILMKMFLETLALEADVRRLAWRILTFVFNWISVEIALYFFHLELDSLLLYHIKKIIINFDKFCHLKIRGKVNFTFINQS